MRYTKSYEYAMVFAYNHLKHDLNSLDYDKNNLIYNSIITALGWTEAEFNNAIISYVDRNWTNSELNL